MGEKRQPEILTGPSARLILQGDGERYRIGFDIPEGNGCGASFPVGGLAHENRGAAIADASRAIRHVMAGHLSPSQVAWLAGLVPDAATQPDLFPVQLAPSPSDRLADERQRVRTPYSFSRPNEGSK